MKLLAWLRRDRVAELTTNSGLQAQHERLFPGSEAERFDGTPRPCGIGACTNHAMPGRAFCRECHEVIFACQPIPCDIEDNYVCAAHRNASEAGRR